MSLLLLSLKRRLAVVGLVFNCISKQGILTPSSLPDLSLLRVNSIPGNGVSLECIFFLFATFRRQLQQPLELVCLLLALY